MPYVNIYFYIMYLIIAFDTSGSPYLYNCTLNICSNFFLWQITSHNPGWHWLGFDCKLDLLLSVLSEAKEVSLWGWVEAKGTMRQRGRWRARHVHHRHSHLLQGTLVCHGDGTGDCRTRGSLWNWDRWTDVCLMFWENKCISCHPYYAVWNGNAIYNGKIQN